MLVVFCFFQTSIFVVAGSTYAKLVSQKMNIPASQILSDDLGECGLPLSVRHNPYFNEMLQLKENEQHTCIEYGRVERLLPKELYKALVTKLANKCLPERQST